jgi:single-strand DNA-binding protein
MLNRIILIGRLTRDPEMKYTPQGIAVTKFSLAVDRKYSKGETDFIDVVTWRGLAEKVAQYLSKGRMAAVEGRLQIRSYDRDGQKRRVTEVIADDVRFLERASGGGDPPPKPREMSEAAGWSDLGDIIVDDDMPF